MTMRILWPVMPPEFDDVARDAVGAGFETIFRRSIEEVTDAEWASADAVVGPYPGAANIGKLAKANIDLNRKVLADLAMHHPEAFAAVVKQVK